MATPIKSLFPPIEKKPFLLNKQKSGSRRPTSCIDNMCYQWSSMVKGKQQNLSWQLLFSCVVWNLWLHRNYVIFNDAAPNFQICFSMVPQSIVLWLGLDSNSLELNIEKV